MLKVRTRNLKAFMSQAGMTQEGLAIKINEYARIKGQQLKADKGRVNKFVHNRPGGISVVMIEGCCWALSLQPGEFLEFSR